MNKKSLLFTLVACLALVPACSSRGKQPAAASPSASTSSDLKAPGEAQVGDRTTCPVMGNVFVVTADSPKAEHQGRTYYFCCPGCVAKFQADPSRYLKKVRDGGHR